MSEGTPEHPFPWVRLHVNDLARFFYCERCGTKRTFRSERKIDLRREGHDFLLRHKRCPEKKILLQ